MNKTVIDNLVNNTYFNKNERVFTLNVFENHALAPFWEDIIKKSECLSSKPIFEHFTIVVVDSADKKTYNYLTLQSFADMVFAALSVEEQWRKNVKFVHEMPYFIYDMVLTFTYDLRKTLFPNVLRGSLADSRMISYLHLLWPTTSVYCVSIAYLSQMLPLGRWFSVVSHTLTKYPNNYHIEVASSNECGINIPLMLYVNFVGIAENMSENAEFRAKQSEVCTLFMETFGEQTDNVYEKNFCLTEIAEMRKNPSFESIMLCLHDIENIIRQYICIDSTQKEINDKKEKDASVSVCSVIKIESPFSEQAAFGELFSSFADGLRDSHGEHKKQYTSRYAQWVNATENDPFSSTFALVKCSLGGFSFENDTNLDVEDGEYTVLFKDVSIIMDNTVVSALPRQWLNDRQLKGENMLNILKYGIAKNDGHASLWHTRFVQMFFTKDVRIFANLVKCMICYLTRDEPSRNILLSKCSVAALPNPDDSYLLKVLIARFEMEAEKSAKDDDRLLIVNVFIRVFVLLYSKIAFNVADPSKYQKLFADKAEHIKEQPKADIRSIVTAIVRDLLGGGHIAFRDAISYLDMLSFSVQVKTDKAQLAIVKLDSVVIGQSANSIVRPEKPQEKLPSNISSVLSFFSFIECVCRGLSMDSMHNYNKNIISELIKGKTFMNCRFPIVHLKGMADEDAFPGCSRNDFIAVKSKPALKPSDALYGIQRHLYQYMKQFDSKDSPDIIKVHLGAPCSWITSEFGKKIEY